MNKTFYKAETIHGNFHKVADWANEFTTRELGMHTPGTLRIIAADSRDDSRYTVVLYSVSIDVAAS